MVAPVVISSCGDVMMSLVCAVHRINIWLGVDIIISLCYNISREWEATSSACSTEDHINNFGADCSRLVSAPHAVSYSPFCYVIGRG